MQGRASLLFLQVLDTMVFDTKRHLQQFPEALRLHTSEVAHISAAKIMIWLIVLQHMSAFYSDADGGETAPA